MVFRPLIWTVERLYEEEEEEEEEEDGENRGLADFRIYH